MIQIKEKIFNDYDCDFQEGHIIDKINNSILEETLIGNYLHVRIRTSKNRSAFFPVHQILMHTLNGKKKRYEVHHINGIKTDNRCCNLQYIPHEQHSRITFSENIKNAWKNKREKMIQNSSNGGKKAMQKASKDFHSKGGKAGYKALVAFWNDEKRKEYGKITSEIFKNRKWMNNGIVNVRVDKEQVEQWIEKGFSFGRIKK